MTNSESKSVPRIKRENLSLRHQVSNHIRDAILNGVFKPGEKLIERDLCEQLDISRTLLREAVQQLQAEGLITTILYKGPSVSIIGEKEVDDLYEVRGALEGLAASGFVRNADKAQRKKLRVELKKIKKIINTDDTSEIIKAAAGFYDVLFAGCGNLVITETLTQLTNRLMPFRRLSLSVPGRVDEMFDELESVVIAIEENDEQKAGLLSKQHVASAGRAALQHLIDNKEN